MKDMILYLLVGLSVLSGCGRTPEVGREQKTTPAKMVLGWVDRSVLDMPEYKEFKTTYDTVHIGDQFVEMIRGMVAGVDFTIFFGTWWGCLPGGFDSTAWIDRKRGGDGLTEEFDISFVPTIILLKNGKEIGRIVEKPRATLEEDILSILAAAWLLE